MVGYGIISPSIPLFAKALSATDSQMGYAFAGYPIAFTLSILPLGLLVDRIGKNCLIISASMYILSLASLIMAFSTSIGMLILARALQGLASASAWVATQPLVTRGTGGGEVSSQEMSIVTIAAGVGVIVGPLLGGVGQLETPFFINGALAFFWGLSASLFLTRQGTAAPEKRKDLLGLLKQKGILVACIAIFCSCACFGIMELLLPLYLDRLGFVKASIGIFFGIFSVLYVASQPLISRWINRKGGYVPIYIGSLGLSVGMAVVIHITGFVSFSIIMSFLGIQWHALSRIDVCRWGREQGRAAGECLCPLEPRLFPWVSDWPCGRRKPFEPSRPEDGLLYLCRHPSVGDCLDLPFGKRGG